MNLTDKDKEIIKKCLDEGKPIPSIYKQKLFNTDDTEFVEATKDYKLVYKGKARKEDIIAKTPAAPLQKIRSFNSDNAFEDDWSNMLIFGDNLLALKAIYEDQRGPNLYKTKNKIKLIYIDPPFATKQDFMKDREKAYRDKIIGAQFIEFLRKRLIMLREILADDGSIYVHLDQKKGHYIKGILDEVFGEHNFRNEIKWQKLRSVKSQSGFFSNLTDSIFFYTKSDSVIYEPQFTPRNLRLLETHYRHTDPKSGLRYNLADFTQTGQGDAKYFGDKLLEPPVGKHWIWSQERINQGIEDDLIVFSESGKPYVKRFFNPDDGERVGDLWNDINPVNQVAKERVDYPTQKPETLLKRIIKSSSRKGDIVLDCFLGSGTSAIVAEKLQRKWIGVDAGKLSNYTAQARLLQINNVVGAETKDETREHERIADINNHSKSNSRGLFLVYEKARAGDLIITDTFLENLAQFISNNLAGNKVEEFSLACPEEKFKVKKLEIIDNEDSSEAKAGEKVVKVGKVKFLISFIQLKEKTEKPKPHKAKEFTLYHAGIYDNQLILQMDWDQYRPFVAQLFGVRISEHKVHSLKVDGYIGVNSAYIWDYPNQKDLLLDEEYVKTLHEALGGRAGDKFYVIAPISSLGFMQDEIRHGNTTYVFLKVPLSVLMALINKGEPGALKQPTSETDVNEVMDAIGFDFISQPQVKANYKRATPDNKDLFNASDKDYVIEITEFKSNTLAYDPEDFENFETFSMVMVDTNYNGEYFHLNEVFWADKILDTEAGKAIVRIPEKSFTGEKMMIIFMDKYGNELKVTRTKKDFA
jgi:site-specific DNA-methyltransferase (adenine-specific)/adenine-specific DNA-methyltransferase